MSTINRRYKPIVLFLYMIIMFVTSATPVLARWATDQLGRESRLPDDPKRVITLAPSLTEIVFALKQEYRLVGVTTFSDYPETAKTLPRVGSYVHLDIERILVLKPDLCIAIKDGNPIDVVKRLTALGIPVYVVDPRDLTMVMETITRLGQILNAKAKAAALVKSMQNRVDRVKTVVQKASDRPRVFFQIGVSPIVSVGTNTFIHELIVLAGGNNIAAGAAPYPRFSREQVLDLAPEVIIITSMARSVLFEKVKAEWQQWPNLPAVRNDRIFIEDSDLLHRPTPRLVEGLELLLKLLHPELKEGTL